MTDILITLTERGNRYGVFSSHAKITQDIKRAMNQGNWSKLADDQKECLEMLAHKIGRIIMIPGMIWWDIQKWSLIVCCPTPAMTCRPRRAVQSIALLAVIHLMRRESNYATRKNRL